VSQIERFTPDSIIFDDKTVLTDIDTIILATGFKYHIPYLTAGGHLTITPDSKPIADESHTLRTNMHYIWPLWRHTLSLDPTYPLGSLFFINLAFPGVATFCSVAQGLFAAHTILKSELLDSREVFLADLKEQEARYRANGYNPERVGPKLVLDQGVNAFQDGIVRYLQDRGLGGWPEIPPAGENYTPAWRTLTFDYQKSLKRAWNRLEASGEDVVREWLEGVETEEQWIELLGKLSEWNAKIEKVEALSRPPATEEGISA